MPKAGSAERTEGPTVSKRADTNAERTHPSVKSLPASTQLRFFGKNHVLGGRDHCSFLFKFSTCRIPSLLSPLLDLLSQAPHTCSLPQQISFSFRSNWHLGKRWGRNSCLGNEWPRNAFNSQSCCRYLVQKY